MTDIQKEREMQANSYRVLMNGLVLLDIGLFPGKHAVGLEEFKGLVVAIRDDVASKLQSITPPPQAPPPPPAGAPVPSVPPSPVGSPAAETTPAA